MIGYRFTPRLSLGVKLTILETRYNQCAAIQRKEVDGDFRESDLYVICIYIRQRFLSWKLNVECKKYAWSTVWMSWLYLAPQKRNSSIRCSNQRMLMQLP